MAWLTAGIDEAGYGPTLGPLSIAAISVAVEELQTAQQRLVEAETGIKDSKALTAAEILLPRAHCPKVDMGHRLHANNHERAVRGSMKRRRPRYRG